MLRVLGQTGSAGPGNSFPQEGRLPYAAPDVHPGDPAPKGKLSGRWNNPRRYSSGGIAAPLGAVVAAVGAGMKDLVGQGLAAGPLRGIQQPGGEFDGVGRRPEGSSSRNGPTARRFTRTRGSISGATGMPMVLAWESTFWSSASKSFKAFPLFPNHHTTGWGKTEAFLPQGKKKGPARGSHSRPRLVLFTGDHVGSGEGFGGQRVAAAGDAVKGVFRLPQFRGGEKGSCLLRRVRGQPQGDAAAGRDLPQDGHSLKGKAPLQCPLSLNGPAGGGEGDQAVIHVCLHRDDLGGFLHPGHDVVHVARPYRRPADRRCRRS